MNTSLAADIYAWEQLSLSSSSTTTTINNNDNDNDDNDNATEGMSPTHGFSSSVMRLLVSERKVIHSMLFCRY